MAATKDWEAVLYRMLNNSTVINIVAKDASTTPLVVYGTLDTAQEGLPFIAFNRSVKNSQYGIGDGYFIVNCYAEKQYESSDLAEVVNNLFRNSIGHIDGYPLETNSNILRSIPSADCVNTPVIVRVINGGH